MVFVYSDKKRLYFHSNLNEARIQLGEGRWGHESGAIVARHPSFSGVVNVEKGCLCLWCCGFSAAVTRSVAREARPVAPMLRMAVQSLECDAEVPRTPRACIDTTVLAIV